MTDSKPAIGDIYRHYKHADQFYEIIGIGKDTETKEDVVIYRAQYDSPEFGPKPFWVRPLAMFMETVVVDGKTVPRFERVDRHDRR
jgi:hypothetical protein